MLWYGGASGLPAIHRRLLEVKLPPSLRVIYRLHNGQDLSCDDRFPDLMPYDSMFHGLLGG